MPRLSNSFLLLLFLNIGTGNELFLSQAAQTPPVPQGATPEARGEWLARAVRDRDQWKDAQLSMRMQLFDRQQRRRERTLSVLTLRGGRGRPVDGDRTLVRFTAPADIKGTSLLVWEHPAAEDERFLYLPSLGRVRRIAASESQDSFAGSDFTYEDIGGRQLDDYRYRLLDTPAEWAAADGTRHAVYALESISRMTGARFPRVVSLVRRDNFVVVHAAIHNKRDELQRTYDVLRLDRVKSYWTALSMSMADTFDRTRTTIDVERAEYDTGLTEEDVSRRALERGGSR